jgi:dTDP-4-amino-4,6-dideoxygalactose transaminase
MHAMKPVPFLDLGAQFAALKEEWFAAIEATGAKGQFILGPQVEAFEQEFAEYTDTRHAIAVANGTDALVLALKSFGVGPGDEVITSPFSFFASAEAIDLAGATPVFADILPDSFTLDPDSVRECITGRTRAIIPVHLFGQACDMAPINAISREHGAAIVEDCAQACGARDAGARVGALGDAGAFSFYPTKVLGCYGDGGMITTNNADADEHIRRLRNHGAIRPFIHVEIGANSRLDEIQAALLRIKLRTLEQDIDDRRRIAAAYTERLAHLPLALPAPRAPETHVYNLYTIRSARRDALRDAFVEQRIGHSLCYPLGLHLQQVYQSLGYAPGSLPGCELATREAISLPVYPGMPLPDIERICTVIEQVAGDP